ncbi:MAG: glutathione S-transferase family protein [Proteobacteria bacterium]|nr:glutathione S-transferase family protein [Pseudomonadota bacterium]
MSNKSPELLAVSPYGKVPVLVDGDRAVYESGVIGEYLEESYPEVRLMPHDPYLRAQVRIWTDYVASRFVSPLYRLLKSEDPEKIEAGRLGLNKELDYLETHLHSTEDEWFVGGVFSLADINLLPFIDRTDKLDRNLLSKYPALEGWLEGFRKRSSYKETVVSD